jgi:hypothetical protein
MRPTDRIKLAGGRLGGLAAVGFAGCERVEAAFDFVDI